MDIVSDLSLALLPYAVAKRKSLRQSDRKLLHYTTGENALAILESKAIWLRNAALMNDFSEVTHGWRCLKHALDQGCRENLISIVDACHPGLIAKVLAKIDFHAPLSLHHSYISSFAEDDGTPVWGKLAMWRAYGGPVSGAALVFNTEVLDEHMPGLNAYAIPVLYKNPTDFKPCFDEAVASLDANRHLVEGVETGLLERILSGALLSYILSTKHPAFEEEKEWRVIHIPWRERSEFISQKIISVRGTPQIVCELPLQDGRLEGTSLRLDRLLHSIKVGPCAFPSQVCTAFVAKLEGLGFKSPAGFVIRTDIPLRQSH